MPFGLCNVPAAFHRCMISILEGLVGEIMEVFIDEISIMGTLLKFVCLTLRKFKKM